MSKWINIKDKLPATKMFNSVYITYCYSATKNKHFVWPLHYISGEWFEMYEEEPLDPEYEVTKWMEMPEPPTNEDTL